jgi:hypothetical protein
VREWTVAGPGRGRGWDGERGGRASKESTGIGHERSEKSGQGVTPLRKEWGGGGWRDQQWIHES